MAVTALSAQVMNPFVGASPANIPTALEKPNWAAIVEKYERRVTPVTNLIKKSTDDWDQNKIQVINRFNPFFATALSSPTTNNSQNLVMTTTATLRVGDILEVADFYSGSTTAIDSMSLEYARVESITNGTTLVATRDMDKTSSGAWPVHASGARVRKVSRASPDNTTFANTPVYRGDTRFNYTQLFESALQTTIKAKNTGSWETKNYWLDDIENVIDELKWEREMAFITGIRMAGDSTSTPIKPFTTGGIIWQLQQNDAANIASLGGRQITVYDIDDILRTVFETHRKGPATHLLASPRTVAIWDLLINPYRDATMSDTSITLMTDTLKFRWATIKVEPTINIPDGIMVFMDPSDWEWNNYKGMDWDVVKQAPKETFKAVESWAMFGEFGILCKDIRRQVLIQGINTDLTQYAGRSFLR